ncbi:MAG TPA: DPP IV N-terminal domain-containing protein [Terriglobales bacterium]
MVSRSVSHPDQSAVSSLSRPALKSEFEIDQWTIQPQLNCVLNGTELVRLEPKVMQVLLELASHPGEVLTKEELLHAVWPDTYVGDDALIRCISELRRVFRDDPRSPRVIQTINKIGYRLIAHVRVVADSAASQPPISQLPPPAIEDEPATTDRFKIRWTSVPFLTGLFVLLIATFLGGLFLLARFANRRDGNVSFRTVPFTTYAGSERQPSFSPDGSQIAFIWNGEKGGDFWNVYVKSSDSETPRRLTTAQAEDLSPEWSPDGRMIAFIRHTPEGDGVYLVPAQGGPEHRIHELHCAIDWDDPGLSWSPDGKFLIFPDGKSQLSPSAIVRLSLEDSRARELTAPETTWDGDSGPAFSPDGKKIAFIRGKDGAARDVYVTDADGNLPIRLTRVNRLIFGLTWTADSKSIIFSSDLGGTASLWSVPSTGGTPTRLPFGTENAFTPAIAAGANRLAYSQGSATWTLIKVDLKSPADPGTRLASSTEQDSAPQFSHDGRRIAFQSWRSGSQEIWTTSSDGSSPARMTSFNGPITGSPRWSPDDRQLTFDSRINGRAHIFLMSADGGTPKAVTSGDFNDIIPSWSADGRWIYFGSKRSDQWQIWKVSVDSGELKQVTSNGGFVAQESLDGRSLYYTKYGVPGLWRLPVMGGNEEKILDDPPAEYWGYFALSRDGIYYLGRENSQPAILFRPFASSTDRALRIFPKWPARFSTITVSPESNSLVYSDQSPQGNNIMLVQDFQ